MVYDRAYLRRRRDAGWLPSYRTGRISHEEAAETGYKQVERLADAIESHTGSSIDSRRALDFGCGWGRLSLPLAERCAHVYGVEVSQLVLAEAERHASEKDVRNVEWLRVDRLAELRGRYDLLISVLVFQHIPVDEGERLFSTLVGGLAEGGVGLIGVTLRPKSPMKGLLGWVKNAARSASNPLRAPRASVQALRGYLHMLKGSYSLNRLGALLADAGIKQWDVEFSQGAADRSYDAARIIFRKD
jgi:SAM-dependent methyltransferase